MFHRRPTDLLSRLRGLVGRRMDFDRRQLPAFGAIAAVLVLALVVSLLSRDDDETASDSHDPFETSDVIDPETPPGFVDPHAPPTTAPPPPNGPEGQWRLAFSDEFGGDGLDRRRWATCYPHGTVGCTNRGNNELEWYRPENVSVGDGNLRLTARPQQITGEDGRRYDYTSGMVTTGPEATQYDDPAKFGFQYGYVEARMKIPSGQGLWPAFWLLPTDLYWPPEIDVMEVLGHEPTRVHLNSHWRDDAGRYQKQQDHFDGPDFTQGWHTFGVEWRSDAIVWYVDGIERNRYENAAHIPQERMFLLLNLAVGGNWPGAPDATTQFPAAMDVDWVRVWKDAS